MGISDGPQNPFTEVLDSILYIIGTRLHVRDHMGREYRAYYCSKCPKLLDVTFTYLPLDCHLPLTSVVEVLSPFPHAVFSLAQMLTHILPHC